MDKAHSLLPKQTDSQGREYTSGWRDALYERMPRPFQTAAYYLGFSQASAHLKAGNRRVLWSVRPVIVPEVVPE